MDLKNELITLWSDTGIYRMPSEKAEITYNGENFSYTELQIIKYIHSHPGVTSIELVKASGRTRGTISLIMKKFMKLGLAVFSDDPTHRKRKLINITPEGEQLSMLRKKADEKEINDIITLLKSKYSKKEIQLISKSLIYILSEKSSK